MKSDFTKHSAEDEDQARSDLFRTAQLPFLGFAVLVVALTLWTARPGTLSAQSGPSRYLNPVDCVAAEDGGTAYVALAGTSQVAVVDLESESVRAHWPLPGSPTGLALSPDGRLLAVTMGIEQGGLALLDTADGSLEGRFDAGFSPCSPVFLERGDGIAVCNRFSDSAGFYSPEGRLLGEVEVTREPVDAVLSVDGARLFVGCLLPAQPADSAHIATTIEVVDVAAREVEKVIELPNGATSLRGMALSPDGTRLFATHVIGHHQVPTNQLERGWMNANALTVVDAEEAERLDTVLLDDPMRGAANSWGVGLTADGQTLAVAHAGTHEISRIPLAALLKTVGTVRPRGIYHVEASVEESGRITVKVNGSVVCSATDTEFSGGTVGFYNWWNDTSFYDNVTVRGLEYGKELMSDNFNDGNLSGWKTGDDNWSVEEGELKHGKGVNDGIAWWDGEGSGDWSGYNVIADLRSLDDDGIGVLFCFQDAKNHYRFQMNEEDGFRRLEKVAGGEATTLDEVAEGYVKGVEPITYPERHLVRELTTMSRCGRQRITMPGEGPRTLAMAGSKALVNEYFSGKLAVVDLSEPDRRTIVPREISLGREPEMNTVRHGELRFNDARLCYQGWQSCATCHPDGRVDALNWDLLNDGIGNSKQTKSMLAAHATPPAMALGVRARAEVAVRAGIRYIQFAPVHEEDAEAMDAYLKTLQAVPSPHLADGELSERARRGREIYERAGCAECHSGEYYTDGKSYEMSHATGMDAGRVFDTPGLVEIWRTAPYLYDGRAPTMEEALKIHGDTEPLSEEDLKALAEYVLSL